MINFIKKIYKSKTLKILYDLREFIALIIFIFAIVKVPFTVSDVKILYEGYKLPKITKLYQLLEQFNDSNSQDSSLLGYCNMMKTEPTIFKIYIKNNINTCITDLDLSICGVEKVYDISIDYNSNKLKAKDDEISSYKLDNQILYFPEFNELPPKAVIVFNIIGKFNSLFIRERIELISSSNNISIKQLGRATGIGLFISNNLKLITLLICFVALFIGLRRFQHDGI